MKEVILKDGVPVGATVAISSDFETLTFVRSDSLLGEFFELTKKDYIGTYSFAFDLRWWGSY
jgi:hypothetical protein